MKSHILTAVISIAVGAAGAWWFAPRRVEVRTEYKDQWRDVTVKKVNKTRTKTTKKPDGTVINDVTVTQSDTDTKSTGMSTAVSVTAPHPRWNVSLLGGVDLKLNPVGGAHLTYRVVGPFSAGVWVLGGPATVAGGVSLGVTF